MEIAKYPDFKKLDIRIGTIKSTEPVPGTTNLLRLNVDIGTGSTVIVAGIAQQYKVEELIDKQIVLIANLEPRMIRGVESRGMLLAAEDGSLIALLGPDKRVAPGSQVHYEKNLKYGTNITWIVVL